MDISSTAQTASTLATGFNLMLMLKLVLSHLAALVSGWFAAKKISGGSVIKDAGIVAEELVKVAPAAETVATLAGKPGVAAGIEAGAAVAQKAIDTVGQIQAAHAATLPTDAAAGK